MGRRYKTEYSNKKDVITYHVHGTNGKVLASYKDKQEALAHKATNAKYKITKTRKNIEEC